MAKNDNEKHDIHEVFSPDADPESAIKEVLDATDAASHEVETEPDVINDPGVEGGVDEPNESSDEPGSEA